MEVRRILIGNGDDEDVAVFLGKRANLSILYVEVTSLWSFMNNQSFRILGRNTTRFLSLCFFSGLIEKLIESYVDGHDVDPLMIDKEEVDYPLKGMEESSKSITVDSSCSNSK